MNILIITHSLVILKVLLNGLLVLITQVILHYLLSLIFSLTICWLLKYRLWHHLVISNHFNVSRITLTVCRNILLEIGMQWVWIGSSFLRLHWFVIILYNPLFHVLPFIIVHDFILFFILFII